MVDMRRLPASDPTPAEAQHRAGPESSRTQLPVIDVSPLLGSRTRARRKVGRALAEAAGEVGFFYVEGHGIPAARLEAVYRQAAAWFARPLGEKLRYYIGNSRNHRGYVPVSEQGLYADEGSRNYEAFDLSLDLPADDPDVRRGHYLLGPNVWPAQPGFREAVSLYYGCMADLGQAMCAGFELALGVPEGTLRRAMTKPTSQLRLLHYLENTSVANSAHMNMGAHTDYECFTILHQRAPGLEVLVGDRGWVEAPPLEGTLVVNIGDLLETWSNGLFRSTYHRVVNNGHERYSLPFFVAADYDAVIAPLPKLVSTDRPAGYAPVVAGHHLLGQLLRDFPYLRERYRRGELRLPFGIPSGNPFETAKALAQA